MIPGGPMVNVDETMADLAKEDSDDNLDREEDYPVFTSNQSQQQETYPTH